MEIAQSVISFDDSILVTGSNGFLGAKVVQKLLESGFQNLRCFVRSGGDFSRLTHTLSKFSSNKVKLLEGNMTDMDDCYRATDDVVLVINCAAGMQGGLVNMFIDSVVASRNLLAAIVVQRTVKRIVHISSFATYETATLRKGTLITEETPLESHHKERNDPYSYTKLKQEQIFWKYAREYHLPLVVLRPGVIFGPGGLELHIRVGLQVPQLQRFVFLVGGANTLPLTYVDNCAEAAVLAGVKPAIEGKTFNIVDDDLPTSRIFLDYFRQARKNTRSIWVPYFLVELLSRMLSWYSDYSQEQIPVIISPHRVASTWKGFRFDNSKAKKLLGWKPTVTMTEALNAHFESLRSKHA
jgi:nucleoside-diphosphate-sugar epimerase